MYGWVGKILRVDLSKGTITTEDTKKYTDYLGGLGFGYKVIFDEAPKAGPFDPENRLVFAVGPLTGTLAPGTSRPEVISITPHSYASKSKHAMASRSNFGGYWGAELKFAGFDAIIVQGKAAKPVYININNDKVTIEDGAPVWGQDALEAQETIKKLLNDENVQIATIGPAGERRVRIAPIIHRLGNVARQGGFGAVMGSKNLKAIAVRGTHGVKVADEKGLIEYVGSVRAFQPAPLGATPLSSGPLSWTGKGIDPKDIKHQALRFNQTESNAPWLNKYHLKTQSCYSCPQGCYTYMRVPKLGTGAVSCTQWFYAWMGNRDEATFEASQLVNQLGLDSFEMFPMIQFIWFLQDEEVGGKSVLRHMYDQKLVSKKNLDVLEAAHYPRKGGDLGSAGLKGMLTMMAYREDFLGDALGEGFRRAMDIISDEFKKRKMPEVADGVMKFMNMEGIMGGVVGGNGGWGMSAHYDPRTFGYYWAVNFAMENSDPMRHSMTNLIEWTGLSLEQAMPAARKHWGKEVAENGLNDIHRDRSIPLSWNSEKSAKANATLSQFIHYRGCIKDSMVGCDWVYPVMTSGREDREYIGDISVEYKLLGLVTGEKMTQEKLNDQAARVWTLQRLLTALEWNDGKPINLREEHDQIPDHFFAPVSDRVIPPYPPTAVPHPPLVRENFEATKTEYYKLMGWDVKTGLPTRSLLKKLGMTDVLTAFEAQAFPLPA